jgi:hypothetical protein
VVQLLNTHRTQICKISSSCGSQYQRTVMLTQDSKTTAFWMNTRNELGSSIICLGRIHHPSVYNWGAALSLLLPLWASQYAWTFLPEIQCCWAVPNDQSHVKDEVQSQERHTYYCVAAPTVCCPPHNSTGLINTIHSSTNEASIFLTIQI